MDRWTLSEDPIIPATAVTPGIGGWIFSNYATAKKWAEAMRSYKLIHLYPHPIAVVPYEGES